MPNAADPAKEADCPRQWRNSSHATLTPPSGPCSFGRPSSPAPRPLGAVAGRGPRPKKNTVAPPPMPKATEPMMTAAVPGRRRQIRRANTTSPHSPVRSPAPLRESRLRTGERLAEKLRHAQSQRVAYDLPAIPTCSRSGSVVVQAQSIQIVELVRGLHAQGRWQQQAKQPRGKSGRTRCRTRCHCCCAEWPGVPQALEGGPSVTQPCESGWCHRKDPSTAPAFSGGGDVLCRAQIPPLLKAP